MPTPTLLDSYEDRKGRQVQVRGASARKHFGYIGAWIDTAKPATNLYAHVIFEKPYTDERGNNSTYFESRRILKDNLEEPDTDLPSTYLQAAFQQIPQLNDRVDALALTLAKCRIVKSEELTRRINNAIDKAGSKLLRQGPRATYYLIDQDNIIPLPSVSDDEA